MIAWLEASWGNVILLAVGTAIACAVALTAAEALPLRRPAPRHHCPMCELDGADHDG